MDRALESGHSNSLFLFPYALWISSRHTGLHSPKLLHHSATDAYSITYVLRVGCIRRRAGHKGRARLFLVGQACRPMPFGLQNYQLMVQNPCKGFLRQEDCRTLKKLCYLKFASFQYGSTSFNSSEYLIIWFYAGSKICIMI